MSAPATAPQEVDRTPASSVLETFLGETLRLSIENSQRVQQEIERRIDILFALTDGVSHRRALPFPRLAQEIRSLEPSELVPIIVTDEELRPSLKVLVHHRLLREFDSTDGTHYELAHDFLVRFVVQKYRALERDRIAAIALLKQQRQATDTELARLSKLGTTVSWLLRLLPIVTFTLTIGLLIYAMTESLPGLFGLSYLWLLAVPGAALLLLGIATRRPAAILLAALVLLCCAATWLYEQSIPLEDIAETRQIAIPTYFEPDWCMQFSISAAAAQAQTSSAILLSRCQKIRSGPWDEDTYRMIYNARGLQGDTWLRGNPNFCFDVGKVFGTGSWSDQLTLWHICWDHTPEWSFFLEQVGSHETRYLYRTGVMLRPYELGELDSSVAWFALLLLIAHPFIYPAVVLGTLKSPVVIAAVRRCLTEVGDVIIALAILYGLSHLYQLFWLFRLRWLPSGLTIIVLDGLIYIMAASVVLIFTRKTIAGLITRLAVEPAKENPVAPASKLLARACILWAWSILNLFFGLPSLIITPLYVWLQKDHQLWYDVVLKLRTDRKQTAGMEKRLG